MIKSDFFKKWIDLDRQIFKSKSNDNYIIYVQGECYNNIFISNSKKNNRVFYIEFSPNTLKNYNPPTVTGVKICVKDNPNIDENKLYLVFENENIELDDAFIGFSVTVMNSLSDCKNDIDTITRVEQILKDYHNFFSFKKDLGKDAEQGLLAELSFLSYLIDIKGEEVVTNWFGPEKNKRDFLFHEIAVEIKSTRNQEQDIIHVSNENQLDKNDLEKLYIRLYIYDENDLGNDVSKMIKEIYDKLNNVAMKKLFISKLCMFNIQPLEYQAKYKFKEEGIHTYDINDEFPKLTKYNIPKSIYDVKYKINLSGVSYIEKEV
jgi:hypothetical protein